MGFISSKTPPLLILTVVLLLITGRAAFAQDDYQMAFGLGPEWNMNSRNYFAGGAGLNFDYNLFRSFAAGASVIASTNFAAFTALETAGMFRWYIFSQNHSGFFAQADAGVFLYMENERTVPKFLGGLRAGVRLPLSHSFYIEPYAREGYPFAFGIGVIAGMCFSPEKKKADTETSDEELEEIMGSLKR